jgi:hypothetical protein
MKRLFFLPIITNSENCVKEFLHTLALGTQSSRQLCESYCLIMPIKNSVAETVTFQICLSIKVLLLQLSLRGRVYLLHCLQASNVFSMTAAVMLCIGTLPKIQIWRRCQAQLPSNRRNIQKASYVALTIYVALLTHTITQLSSTVDVYCLQCQ